MLANKQILIKAQSSLAIKNYLINQLNSVSQSDKHRLFKYALAFILGSSLKINHLFNEKPTFKKSYLHSFYNCFLLLEYEATSHASTYPNILEIIRRCQTSLLLHFNRRYRLLLESPENLLKYWREAVNQLEYFTADRIEKTILKKIADRCQIELSIELIKEDKIAIKTFRSFGKASVSNYLHRMVIEAISQKSDAKLIFPLHSSSQYELKHIFVKNDNGIILDALHVSKIGVHSKTVVLMQFASMRPEEFYLFYNLENYYKLFNTDVVFIKNRNASSRSSQAALHSAEVAQDIIAFVNHYKKQANIVLYGMCGGAPHMIVAAESLCKQKIPYKLIVDRFASSYSNFYQLHTVVRFLWFNTHFIKDRPDVGKPKKFQALAMFFLLITPLMLILSTLARPLFKLSKETINYGNIVRSLPESDVLILQGKEKKEVDDNALSIDFAIPTINSLRYAVKDLRQLKKNTLFILQQKSLNLSLHFATDYFDLTIVFTRYADFFKTCLKLISNEKLTLDPKPAQITDIHSQHLFALTTRHHLPVRQFVTGFFKPIPVTVNFDSIPIYETGLIINALPPSAITNTDEVTAAEELSSFLQIVNDNSTWLCRMADRVLATYEENIGKTIERMLEAPLFQSLAKAHHSSFMRNSG
ncbi:hypothetical protein [Legionella clemsonensis]|uniref:Uncharacterized protein n=1 Tax=Legionella clemsonensis TaxID=1867846 RepID=A0A222NYH5_9GAMM|nr:hypothetical protein [Legionella clemsonensis]ASQ44647.1 hypothetical protein clem_00405 [Legionella clemsonensis]